MQGLHLTADLYRCRADPHLLRDAGRLRETVTAAAAEVGLPAGQPCFDAHPDGVSGLLLLPGAHVSVHTAAALRGATLDVFLRVGGGEGPRLARVLMDRLIEMLQPEWTEQRSLMRGDEA